MNNEEDFEGIDEGIELEPDSVSDTNQANQNLSSTDENINDKSGNDKIGQVLNNNENTENNLVSNQMLGENSNESQNEIHSNLKDRLEENKTKGYERANSGKEAYQKKLDSGKDYYKNKLNENKDQQEKLKKDKDKNNERRDSAEKRLEQAKQNKRINNNRNNRSELRSAKKEYKEDQREEKKQNQKEKSLKEDEKNIKKDSKKADHFKKLHPVEAAKMAAENQLRKIRNLIMIKIVVPVTLIVFGVFLAIFVIYAMFSPVLEIFDKVDESVTNVSNNAEKFINWMKGFGYENTKDAFYDEVKNLNEKYDGEINIPLIMSTLYYTETDGYDTSYGDMESLFAADTGDIDGFSAEALWETVKQYVMEKLKDATGETDENGIRYTTGKIVRMRKLARQQFNTSKFGDESIEDDVKSDDNYRNYLITYYIPTMPEFKKYLPSNAEEKEAKIQQIVNDIYTNEEIFRDIYLQYVDTDSEVYTNNCVGAIDINLVPSLGLPVNIKSGTSVSFVDGATAFGIRGGVNHNGVDLNSSTAGVSDGDLVYAIADGEVVSSLPNVSCNTRQDENCAYTQGAWVRIKHNIVVKNKEYNFYSVYMHLKTNSGQPQVGTKVKKGDVIGKIGNTGDSSGSHLHFEFRDDDGTANGKAIDPTNLFIPCNTGTSETLVGNDDTEKIWNYFASKGYPKNGIAGIMGNIKEESGFISNRIQSDYLESDPVSYRNEYTLKVDNGSISKNDFSKNGPGGGGYGLVQWTYYTRKEGLYDYAKNLNVSIGDLGMQLNYLDNELKNSYKDVYNVVTSSTVTIDSATRKFMIDFERPANQTESAQRNRINNSISIYNLYGNK